MSAIIPRICVIGAGISGVSAAEYLYNKGYSNICIYEALGRIGGRIHTQYFKENDETYRIEAGAQWIHGIEENPVFDIARNHGLKITFDESEFGRRHIHVCTDEGEIIKSHLYTKVSEWYGRTYDECESFYKCRKFDTPDESVEAYIKRSFYANLVPTLDDGDISACEKILNYKLTFESSVSGSESMDEVSSNQFGSYVELKGDHPEIYDGYIKIVNTLAAKIPTDLVKLNSPVQQIICNGENVSVQLENGSLETFDHVIVTCSLAFLQNNHRSFFSPMLPFPKQEALEKLAMGTADKIFLKFDDLNFLDKQTAEVCICSSFETDTTVDWTAGLQQIMVCRKPNPNMVMFYLTGRAAKKMESLSDEEVIAGCMSVLRRSLKGGGDVPRPTTMWRSSWFSNKYICGGYTYIPVGGSVDHIRKLAQPISSKNKPLLMFAGEATHPEYYSAVHGALLSGQREALRLLQYYQADI